MWWCDDGIDNKRLIGMALEENYNDKKDVENENTGDDNGDDWTEVMIMIMAILSLHWKDGGFKMNQKGQTLFRSRPVHLLIINLHSNRIIKKTHHTSVMPRKLWIESGSFHPEDGHVLRRSSKIPWGQKWKRILNHPRK